MKLCGHCKKYSSCEKQYSSNSNYAERCKNFDEKHITNFEKIKKMSADEVATAILEGVSSDPCDYCNRFVCDGKCYYKSAYEVIKNWLESEAEE